jgi:FkbM family methyltransferase
MISGNDHDCVYFAASYFPKDFKGVYVDVGAGFPEFWSNSIYFRKLGWEIIAIEPQPHMCAEFRRLGYPILEYACASTDIGQTDFEICDILGGLSASAFRVLDVATRAKATLTPIKVEALTLNTILERHHPELKHIDILDVDVEYSELDVLKGLDFNKYNPAVLIIENLPTDTGLYANPHRAELYEYYKTLGYKIVDRADFNEILRRG